MFELYYKGKKIALFESRELAEKYAWENRLGNYGIFERRWNMHPTNVKVAELVDADSRTKRGR